MTTQPKALRLADELEAVPETGAARRQRPQLIVDAAAELRLLHAELQRCKQVCDATAEGWRTDAEEWKAERAALAEHTPKQEVQEPEPVGGVRLSDLPLDTLVYTAQPTPKQEVREPVAWLPSSEWVACTKLPVTVHVRQQRPGETHVSTREGITPIKPDDFIIRGVAGEEYPIGKKIFEKTYRIGNAAHGKSGEKRMNERIRELREQAWTLVSNEERDCGELYEAREQRERCDQKFAELIARECAELLLERKT